MSKAIRTFHKKSNSFPHAPEKVRIRRGDSARNEASVQGENRNRRGDQPRGEECLELQSIARHSDQARSEASVPVSAGRKDKRVLPDDGGRDAPGAANSNANNSPYVVRRANSNQKPTKSQAPSEKNEDCNNHGCVSFPPSLPQPCTPRKPGLVCCPANPSVIKVLAKLMIFLFVLVSTFYALFRVASGWSKRHEILTLLLFLLMTRIVCKKNWFMPTQYWRNLDPCCDRFPKQVDVTVPSYCPVDM
ncbi:hypothetical protein EGW08_009450 [Elysia chlorotica]|uniref:Uncharacterized protein n=1 Tax=Elysia chlorotica TaxID=188477 RepID=A0A433TMP9_ELYCH|nr:hypothetical protein EGW08_009450 [Elysia chlorotica]